MMKKIFLIQPKTTNDNPCENLEPSTQFFYFCGGHLQNFWGQYSLFNHKQNNLINNLNTFLT